MNVQFLKTLRYLTLACLFVGCGRETLVPPQADLSSLERSQASLIEESRREVISSPKSSEAWGRLGQTFEAADYNRQAMECYQQAQTLDPNSVRWSYLLGLRQLRENPEAGLRNLGRAADLGKLDAPRLRLARALIEGGRADEAETQLGLLLAAFPDHAAGRVELARVNLMRDDLDAAIALLEPCVTNSYTARPALLLLANIAQRRGVSEIAAGMAHRASELPRPLDWPDPFLDEIERFKRNRVKLQDQAHSLLSQGRYPETEAALRQLFVTYPDDPEGLLLLARLHMQQRRCSEAEAILRRYLTGQSNSLNGLTQLGISLLCQEKWAEAADVLRQAVALKPDFAQAHSNLGFALARLGDSKASIASYEEALRCTPGDIDVHLALVEELARVGNTQEALNHFKSAEQLDPEDPRLNQLRGKLR